MTKYHKAGWLINNINVFLTVVEAAKSKIWPRQLWSLVRAYFLVYRRHLYALSSQGRRDGGSLRPYLWELQSPSWGFHLHYLNNLPVVLFLNTAILRVKDFNTWILGRYKHSVYSSQQHSLYCICSSTHPPIDPYIHPPIQPFAHPSTHSHLFINWSLDFSLFLYSSEWKKIKFSSPDSKIQNKTLGISLCFSFYIFLDDRLSFFSNFAISAFPYLTFLFNLNLIFFFTV